MVWLNVNGEWARCGARTRMIGCGVRPLWHLQQLHVAVGQFDSKLVAPSNYSLASLQFV